MFKNIENPPLNQIAIVIFAINVAVTLSQEQPELFKCSSGLQNSHVEIPESLQPPMSENNSQYWKLLHGKNLFQFNFSSSPFHCPSQNTSVISLILANNYTISARPKNHQYILNDYYFTPEGTLKITTGQVREWVNSKRYCISEITDEHIEVKICKPSCGEDDLCLKKCCGVSQIAELDNQKKVQCQELHAPEWTPQIYKEAHGFRNHYEIAQRQIPLHFWHKKLCRPLQILSPSSLVKHISRGMIRILETGKVMVRRTSNHPWKEIQSEHCIDRIQNAGDPQSYSDPSPNDIVVLTGHCDSPLAEKDATTSKVYFATFIISSIFALLTVIVYVSLWDKQNVHGWTVVGFSFCMFFNLVTSAFAHGAGLFQEQEVIESGSTLCVLNGVLQHFFYVAMFSWLTVLCFDLWSAISSMAPTSSKSKNYKRLLGYALFGFGVPTVVVLVAIAIDVGYKDDEDTVVYKPLYGNEFCSVDKTSFVYYTTVVNLILYFFNLIFAGLVAKTLCEFKQATKRATNSSSKKSQSQSVLYLKLFVIMGITWIFEFISWFAAGDDTKWYWSIFDVFNILQAVGIFWIFVCKAEIKEQLCEKYQIIRKVCGTVEHTLFNPTKDPQSTVTSLSNSTAL